MNSWAVKCRVAVALVFRDQPPSPPPWRASMSPRTRISGSEEGRGAAWCPKQLIYNWADIKVVMVVDKVTQP
jgi:hypothetical protein